MVSQLHVCALLFLAHRTVVKGKAIPTRNPECRFGSGANLLGQIPGSPKQGQSAKMAAEADQGKAPKCNRSAKITAASMLTTRCWFCITLTFCSPSSNDEKTVEAGQWKVQGCRRARHISAGRTLTGRTLGVKLSDRGAFPSSKGRDGFWTPQIANQGRKRQSKPPNGRSESAAVLGRFHSDFRRDGADLT